MILIPSRLNSSRLPGKALIEIDGVPLVRRVYETCLQTGLETHVVTPDREIADLFDDALLCHEENVHCGSDACWNAVVQHGLEGNIINVQGDMPYIEPATIRTIAAALYGADVSTGYSSLSVNFGMNIFHCGNWVEDFRRCRGGYPHTGVYAFTRDALAKFFAYGQTERERNEKSEGLRILEAGLWCKAVEVPYTRPIDTEEDLCFYMPAPVS